MIFLLKALLLAFLLFCLVLIFLPRDGLWQSQTRKLDRDSFDAPRPQKRSDAYSARALNSFRMGKTEREYSRPELWFPADEPRAHIGFGRVLSDGEVVAWLEAHDVEPRAFFMRAPGGFNGSYRLVEDEEKSFEEIVADARESAIYNFEEGLESHLIRLHHFAERYTEGEVSTDVNIQKSAKSLLGMRSAFEIAHESAVQGDPLIYSIEVAGEDAALLSLPEGGNRDFEATVTDPETGTLERTPSPFEGEARYRDPRVEAMDGEEVYAEIARLGEEAPDVPTGVESDLQGAN